MVWGKGAEQEQIELRWAKIGLGLGQDGLVVGHGPEVTTLR